MFLINVYKNIQILYIIDKIIKYLDVKINKLNNNKY